MTSRRRHALALVAALVAAPTLARAGEPVRNREPPPSAHEPPPGSERVEIHVRFPPWEYSGTFRIETAAGTIRDEGVARDLGGFAMGTGVVERVLEGSKGTITLRIQGSSKSGGFPPIFGRWTLASGTGAYASLSGSGTVTSCAAGAPKGGSPYELQTLLGHVVRVTK
ncbi:hypothetical protein [Anaeromyxobacter oryzae]|uniref:Uncharacterized protein n=1 Tax=Anaeromyxobacter oryzae TaxID=2918170 RepID=A0ABM7WRT1_9BACT|nr:hypothetical protein [Anaeromyxobacter oryzae]BDG02159.1 hypothetical protein AMOR_11550 [Anaeromyxobacter oryzae]